VRRLRAKLGPEYEALIGTVRNVGYRFVAQQVTSEIPDDSEDPDDPDRVPDDARLLTGEQ